MITEKKYKWSQQREDRAINREIIDEFIGRKHCTLITNQNFDCGKLHDYSLVKGKEPQCHCSDFINCPAFNQYISHEILRRRRRTDTTNQPKDKTNGSQTS